jgi:hypothetical protein
MAKITHQNGDRDQFPLGLDRRNNQTLNSKGITAKNVFQIIKSRLILIAFQDAFNQAMINSIVLLII